MVLVLKGEYSLIPTSFFSTSPSAGLSTSTVMGTTISLLEAPSQAMCPGKASTLGTSWVSRVAAAAPQTPLPKSMVWQATLPMKGPRMSDGCPRLDDGSRT